MARGHKGAGSVFQRTYRDVRGRKKRTRNWYIEYVVGGRTIASPPSTRNAPTRSNSSGSVSRTGCTAGSPSPARSPSTISAISSSSTTATTVERAWGIWNRFPPLQHRRPGDARCRRQQARSTPAGARSQQAGCCFDPTEATFRSVHACPTVTSHAQVRRKLVSGAAFATGVIVGTASRRCVGRTKEREKRGL